MLCRFAMRRFLIISIFIHGLLLTSIYFVFKEEIRALKGSWGSSGKILVDRISFFQKPSLAGNKKIKNSLITNKKSQFLSTEKEDSEFLIKTNKGNLMERNLNSLFSPFPKSRKGGAYGQINEDLFFKIRRQIEDAKIYPWLALRKKISGTVFVQFQIDEKGQPIKTKILESSGSRILDQETLNTLKRAAPYPIVTGVISFPLRYDLSDRT